MWEKYLQIILFIMGCHSCLDVINNACNSSNKNSCKNNCISPLMNVNVIMYIHEVMTPTSNNNIVIMFEVVKQHS